MGLLYLLRLTNDYQTHNIYLQNLFRRYLFIFRQEGAFQDLSQSGYRQVGEVSYQDSDIGICRPGLITEWFDEDAPADGPAVMTGQ